MKTTIFALAALFGLGLSLAVMGVSHGLLILAALLPFSVVATLIWALANKLPTLPIITNARAAALALAWARSLSYQTAQMIARARNLVQHVPLPPLTLTLSVLMGLALGAALARDSSDLPAALLCGALAAILHVMAFGSTALGDRQTLPTERIADDTQAHLTRLITALAPCRDPHLHVAARALRREAQALAAQVDHHPAHMPQARSALTLWLPALADAAEHLRQQHVVGPDPALNAQLSAELTTTLTRVATHLAALAPQADNSTAAPSRHEPLALAQSVR